MTLSFRAGPLALLIGVSVAVVQAQTPPLRMIKPDQSARVYARDGSLIAELGPEVRHSVSIATLPPYVWKAFVAVEDHRFFEHSGVDPVGIARAIGTNLVSGFGKGGASTITQQLVGNMFPTIVDRKDISLSRKVKEAEMSMDLEEGYSKQEILEAYLNQIPFGHGWYGIDAAATHYFGKPAQQLSIEEAAMLAALPKGPGLYSPKLHPAQALARRNLVLDIMARESVISVAQATAAKGHPIRLTTNDGYSVRPPWVIEMVRQWAAKRFGADFSRSGISIWTSIDPELQRLSESALDKGLRAAEATPGFPGPRYSTTAPPPKNGAMPDYLQGMVLSMDVRTGEVLAVVGGRDFKQSQFNRATSAVRQPGSTFKGIVYSAAIEAGASPATMMMDTALAIRLGDGSIYRPKNDDNIFRGPVTVRYALAESVNTIAIQLALSVGLDSMVAMGRRFGIASPMMPYPATAIGAGGATPLEMTRAFAAIDYGGVEVEPFTVRMARDASGNVLYTREAVGVQVISPQVAFVMTDMLRTAAEQGTGRPARAKLDAAVPMAGKTGTTDAGTDVWYIGFTPEIITTVWMGFDRPKSLGPSAYGGVFAAPVWGEIMDSWYRTKSPPLWWTPPAGVEAFLMDPASHRPISANCPPQPDSTRAWEWWIGAPGFEGTCLRGGGSYHSPPPPPPAADTTPPRNPFSP